MGELEPNHKQIEINRPHWSDRKPRGSKFQLDRNENYDTQLSNFLDDIFLPGLRASAIIQYPDIRGGYEALSRFTGIHSSRLFLTSGSELAIRHILETHRPVYKTLSICDPTFGMAEVYSNIWKYKLTRCKYRYNRKKKRFSVNYKPKQISYIASPDNPTGHVFDCDDLIDACETSKLVILDEAYQNFSPYTTEHLLDTYDNLYIIRTFSKCGGAAGLRIGYIISTKQNIQHLYQYRPMYEISSIACEYLKVACRFPSTLDSSVTSLKLGKHKLEQWFKNRGYHVARTHGNFTLVEYNNALAEVLYKLISFKTVVADEQKFIRISSADRVVVAEIINHVSRYDHFLQKAI